MSTKKNFFLVINWFFNLIVKRFYLKKKILEIKFFLQKCTTKPRQYNYFKFLFELLNHIVLTTVTAFLLRFILSGITFKHFQHLLYIQCYILRRDSTTERTLLVPYKETPRDINGVGVKNGWPGIRLLSLPQKDYVYLTSRWCCHQNKSRHLRQLFCHRLSSMRFPN